MARRIRSLFALWGEISRARRQRLDAEADRMLLGIRESILDNRRPDRSDELTQEWHIVRLSE